MSAETRYGGATGCRWRVRTVVPTDPAPREPRFAGFTYECVRPRRNGVDGGLYIVRTPDRVGRTAVLRGLPYRATAVPHVVYQLVDGLELGRELLCVFPWKSDLPPVALHRHIVGDFRRALHYASVFANRIAHQAPPTATEGAIA